MQNTWLILFLHSKESMLRSSPSISQIPRSMHREGRFCSGEEVHIFPICWIRMPRTDTYHRS